MRHTKGGIFPEDGSAAATSEGHKWLTHFQTPPRICAYMASLIPEGRGSVLEPTRGLGNLVRAIPSRYTVTAPEDFFQMPFQRFDCVVMNPPFSSRYAFGVPTTLNGYGMRLGYYILTECMRMSDEVIALMPWFTISDSDVRLRSLMRWGLVSVTALPRSAFQYARIQTVVLQLRKGWVKETVFRAYDLKDDNIRPKLF